METVYKAFFDSPVGTIEITGTENAINSLYFRDETAAGSADLPGLLLNCKHQLSEYFDGKRQSFLLPLNPSGTDFQLRTWHELMLIPFGKTISYLELATRLGDRKCVRAAGSANGKNPLSIFIPCHRVIGSNGTLIGYGGGLWRKKWLLQHEMKYSTLETGLFS